MYEQRLRHIFGRLMDTTSFHWPKFPGKLFCIFVRKIGSSSLRNAFLSGMTGIEKMAWEPKFEALQWAITTRSSKMCPRWQEIVHKLVSLLFGTVGACLHSDSSQCFPLGILFDPSLPRSSCEEMVFPFAILPFVRMELIPFYRLLDKVTSDSGAVDHRWVAVVARYSSCLLFVCVAVLTERAFAPVDIGLSFCWPLHILHAVTQRKLVAFSWIMHPACSHSDLPMVCCTPVLKQLFCRRREIRALCLVHKNKSRSKFRLYDAFTSNSLIVEGLQ